MNLTRVEQIAKAVLYEGYMLYPYRPSSVKNRQRWNFGVLYPQGYRDQLAGAELCSMKTECLIAGPESGLLEARFRFLQLQTQITHSNLPVGVGPATNGWQEAIEREVALPEHSLRSLCERTFLLDFSFPAETIVSPNSDGANPNENMVERRQETIQGTIELSAEPVRDSVFKVRFIVRNASLFAASCDRESMLMHCLISTHAVLGVKDASFVSLLEPPEDLRELAAGCENVGAWPVLVGDPPERETMLASPIILYDYPQIAPESPGDLFDGTEIDEILSLRIMTLTDDEKREIRQSDQRTRQILERTESMPAEQFMKLHGAVRGMRPLKEDGL
jgi:hypothetical protein